MAKKPVTKVVGAKSAAKTREPARKPGEKSHFPIIGIGASVGGLDAFKKLFDAMPTDIGAAFVLVQHLDPSHKSHTHELLARHTNMPMIEARDGMRVEPNHVYVIPPDADLAAIDGALRLTKPIQRRGPRLPIDFFFRSLADNLHEKAICIVLSGAGSDGTLGLKAVEANGGMTLVQSPETAQQDGMPRSAIATGVVDHVLPIEEMPRVIVKYIRHPYVNGTLEPPLITDVQPDYFKSILTLLRARTGHNFAFYKKKTLARRMQRRMGLLHIEGCAVPEFLREAGSRRTVERVD